MKIEAKATIIAILAGLFVVGASWGVSAVIAPHTQKHGKHQEQKRAESSSAAVSVQLVAAGRGFYTQACASCHGDNAQGGYGPSLQNLGDTDTKVAAVIKNGINGKMPAFGDKYNAAQQQAMVTYVQSLSK